jgi:hypothetical protein
MTVSLNDKCCKRALMKRPAIRPVPSPSRGHRCGAAGDGADPAQFTDASERVARAVRRATGGAVGNRSPPEPAHPESPIPKAHPKVCPRGPGCWTAVRARRRPDPVPVRPPQNEPAVTYPTRLDPVGGVLGPDPSAGVRMSPGRGRPEAVQHRCGPAGGRDRGLSRHPASRPRTRPLTSGARSCPTSRSPGWTPMPCSRTGRGAVVRAPAVRAGVPRTRRPVRGLLSSLRW